MNPSPSVYLILGAPESGRRNVIADLIESASSEKKHTILLNEAETHEPNAIKNADIIFWKEHEIHIPSWEHTSEKEVLFFMANGKENPIDQIEAFKYWTEEHGLALTRVIAIVNAKMLHQFASLLKYFKAIIHFSDYVLINEHKDMPNKFIQDFIKAFEKECYPCHLELLKKGRIGNPALILEPEVRRLTHFFEPIEDYEEVPEDPYIARDRKGRRKIFIPSIAEYLPRLV